jgi:hypothetical protein
MKADRQEIVISFYGINAQSMHLAFTRYALARHSGDFMNVLGEVGIDMESFSGPELSTIRRLLRFTYVAGVKWTTKNMGIKLSTFLKLCTILDIHPINVLTIPITRVIKENKEIKIPLFELMGRTVL